MRDVLQLQHLAIALLLLAGGSVEIALALGRLENAVVILLSHCCYTVVTFLLLAGGSVEIAFALGRQCNNSVTTV
jgi:hypothetical protein